MKNFLLFACALLALQAFSFWAEWKPYQFKDGNFKIMLPEKPQTSSGSNNVSIRAVSDGISYTVVYPRNQQDADMGLADNFLKSKIDEFTNGLKEKMEVTLESTEDVKMLNYPAKEVKIRAKQGEKKFCIIYRNLLTPKLFFQFHIIREDNYVDYERAGKFFNSFELMETAPLQTWKPYQFKTANFRIQLPAVPVQKTGALESKAEGISYRIKYDDNGGKGFDPDLTEKKLTECVDAYIAELEKTMKVTLEASTDTKMQGLPAREIRLRTETDNNNLGIVYRVLLTPNFRYQMEIVRLAGYPDYERSGKFFNSFELMKK